MVLPISVGGSESPSQLGEEFRRTGAIVGGWVHAR